MDIGQIKTRLAQRAEAVARELLPRGKRMGAEWCAADVRGGAGDSLRVHLTGDKAGVWCDFANSQGGDLLDLRRAVKGESLAEALRWAKDYLGLREPEFAAEIPAKAFRRPARPAGVTKPQSAALAYLTQQRGLTAQTIERLQLAELAQRAFGSVKSPAVVFPFKSPAGELVLVKYLGTERPDGKKLIAAEADCQPALFGWQALDPNARTVVLCEGEINAASWLQYGAGALATPFGAGGGRKHDWVNYEWENLERFETIFLNFDQDAAGREAVAALAERLGRHRCRVVPPMPRDLKDINDCLVANVPESEILDLLRRAVSCDPPELRRAEEFVDEVVAEFYPTDETLAGIDLPFAGLRGRFAIRRGELTLVTGFTKHGKAQPLTARVLTPTGWVAMGALRIGSRVIGGDGKPCNVTGIFPQGVKPIYRVTMDDGAATECCLDHLWRVQMPADRRHGRGYRVMPLVDILKTGLRRSCDGRNLYCLPMVPPVEMEPSGGLPLDPYLLGVLLGDGCLQPRGVSISSADRFIQDEVASALPGELRLQQTHKYGFGIYGKKGRPNAVLDALRGLGLDGQGSGSKFIPECYFRASVQAREALLQGLCDTDGSFSGRLLEFSTTSVQLARDVCRLVQSLGGKCKIAPRIPRYSYQGASRDGAMSYRCYLSLPLSIVPFRLPRKAEPYLQQRKQPRPRAIAKIEYVGDKEAQCISVDSVDNCYVTDDYIVTHNSQLLNWLHLHLMAKGHRCLIASFEMRARKTLYRMTRQVTGQKQPSEAYIRQVSAWMSDRLWLFDHVGNITTEKIFEVFDYARRRYGVDYFVLDSLMKCGLKGDDYNAQSAFADQLANYVNQHQVHIALVAHPRKEGDDSAPPNSQDIKGASEVANQCHNLLVYWRNKRKEMALEKAAQAEQLSREEEKALSESDALLIVELQREGDGSMSRVRLAFDADSQQMRQEGDEFKPLVAFRQPTFANDRIPEF